MSLVKSGSSILEPWQWHVLVLSTLVKLLLIPTYHSTDFEVHRNWLAITHSLPVSQWYFDETSKWTLDYPPFFAYFSWLLSVPAARWDPRIVDLKGGLDYEAWSCKVYMRLSVIVTEWVLAGALFALSKSKTNTSSGASEQHGLPTWCATAILLHPGLVIVDHIHFQYNGFLFGILLWSVWAAREGRPLLCAFLFSSLLNFKHIYVYIAPAYFIYLLQTYVIRGQPSQKDNISISGVGERLFTLATITLLPFVASLLPLAVSGLTPSAPAGPLGILKQMLSRMFPFSRGLTHAYWAANAWALYTFADRALVKILRLKSSHGNVTRGILGDIEFDVLPQITAGHCFLLTLSCTCILCVRLWLRPTYGSFVEAIGLFGLTSFLFGFHVHEKAVLIALLPLTLLASSSYTMMRKVLILSVAGIVGLFPLLFEPRELPIKLVYTLLWFIMTPIGSTLGLRFTSSAGYFGNQTPTNLDLLIHFAEDAYLLAFVPLVLFVEFIHPLIFGQGDFSLGLSPQLVKPTAAFAFVPAVEGSGDEQSQNKLVSLASAAAHSAAAAIAGAVLDARSSAAEAMAGARASAVDAVADAVLDARNAVEGAVAAVVPHSQTSAANPVYTAAESLASSASSLASDAVSAVVSPLAGSNGDSVTAAAASPMSTVASSLNAAATALASQAALIREAIPLNLSQTLTTTSGATSAITSSGTLEFLPLMMISVYCALGVLWVWFSLGVRYMRGTDDAGDGLSEGKVSKSRIPGTGIATDVKR